MLSSNVTSNHRMTLVTQAVKQANESLLSHNLEVKIQGQWPPKKGDPLEGFDERPDIDLLMKVNGNWIPIDIVYIRKMPQEPETLKDVHQLALDVIKKANDHYIGMTNPNILFSSTGSKFNIGNLKNTTFIIDDEGYIRINGMRIASKKEDGSYTPIKACNIRSHGIVQVKELPDGIINLTDDFDQIRTDGRKGIFCLLNKTIKVTQEHLASAFQQGADLYETYIPIVRTL